MKVKSDFLEFTFKALQEKIKHFAIRENHVFKMCSETNVKRYKALAEKHTINCILIVSGLHESIRYPFPPIAVSDLRLTGDGASFV